VDVGKTALNRVEDVDEVGEVVAQVLLLVGHRSRVVDDEQDVDVPIQVDRDVLELDATLLGVDLRDGAIRTGGQQTDREKSEKR
jgi:hypothetical protein